MVKSILVKSNYPKTGLVTIEYCSEIKELTAYEWNNLNNIKGNSKEEYFKKLRTKIEQLFDNG